MAYFNNVNWFTLLKMEWLILFQSVQYVAELLIQLSNLR